MFSPINYNIVLYYISICISYRQKRGVCKICLIRGSSEPLDLPLLNVPKLFPIPKLRATDSHKALGPSRFRVTPLPSDLLH